MHAQALVAGLAVAVVALALAESARADDGAEVTGQTIHDDQSFASGSALTQVWTIKNSGDTTWSDESGYGYTFNFSSGDQMGAPGELKLGAGESIAPNQSRNWSVPMTAPGAPGTYRCSWQMQHRGIPFGATASVEIIVQPVTPEDKDGDGHASLASGGDDCNDDDADIYPGHPEVCDGKDNDCNGQTDEGLANVACADPCPGLQSCVKGAWTPCDGAAPKPEECNGIDDDCNGETDEGAVCPNGQVCALGKCVEPRPGLDASTPAGPDASAVVAGPDASRPTGADSGLGSTFQGGGCGCAASGAGAWAVALMGLGALGRRRR